MEGMITIVDYGCGNLGSIKNMLKKIGYESIITNEKEKISSAHKIILPGVGSFDTGMSSLKELELIEILEEKALKKKTPFLGICLGMQLMTIGSEEGKIPGLGWFDAVTKRFPSDKRYKVPNMGWNEIETKNNAKLFKEIHNPRFYFVHSYYIEARNENEVMAKANYGIDYTCAFSRENLFGVQFHPEKSHKYGMKLLNNFCEIS